LEVAGIAPIGVPRGIITSLPEILEDSQHNDTAKEPKGGGDVLNGISEVLFAR